MKKEISKNIDKRFQTGFSLLIAARFLRKGWYAMRRLYEDTENCKDDNLVGNSFTIVLTKGNSIIYYKTYTLKILTNYY